MFDPDQTAGGNKCWIAPICIPTARTCEEFSKTAAIKAAKFLSKKIVRDQAIELFRFTSAKMEGSNQFSRWVEGGAKQFST